VHETAQVNETIEAVPSFTNIGKGLVNAVRIGGVYGIRVDAIRCW
jgi:hypothetical protein